MYFFPTNSLGSSPTALMFTRGKALVRLREFRFSRYALWPHLSFISAGNVEAFGPQSFEVRLFVTEAASAQVFEQRVIADWWNGLTTRRAEVERDEMAAAQEVAKIRHRWITKRPHALNVSTRS